MKQTNNRIMKLFSNAFQAYCEKDDLYEIAIMEKQPKEKIKALVEERYILAQEMREITKKFI